MSVRLLLVAANLMFATPLVGQDNPLAEGIAAMEQHDLARARGLFESFLQRVPGSYEANWRLSHVLVDLGKPIPDSVASASRDSLYALAVSYARRAVAANPDGADGHFMLASAIGRHSLTLGRRERLKLAAEIRTEALRALSLDPTHSGAYHVLGRWHAEIRRLSALERFLARNFMGGAILDAASWDEAERNLRLAVEHGPDRIFHRLDLARVLLERDDLSGARDQLDAIARMPRREPMDAEYQREAAMLLQQLDSRSPS